MFHSIIGNEFRVTTPNDHQLSGRVATIREDGLSRNPCSFCAQEAHQRCDICRLSETVAHAISLVELDSFGRFLWIEECYAVVPVN